MKILQNENGYTLLELVISMTILGIVLVFLWGSYLSINRIYIKTDKKAQNLEEARLIINHIIDNFQTYGGCQVIISDDTELEEASNYINSSPGTTDDGMRTVKKVIFNDDTSNPKNNVVINYDINTKELQWVKGAVLEIKSEVNSFNVRKDGNLIDFTIELVKEGHGVIADQTLEIGTTLNLRHMPTIR